MNNSKAAHQAKTGRKGDPRMHRAVAARMENPELSLFEALRVGGFDYPADEDASIMDAEKVTLGQRKNQLSRRLRLARKQQEESMSGGGSAGGGGGGDHRNHNGMMDHHSFSPSMGGGLGNVPGLGGMNHAASSLNAKMKLQLQQQQNAPNGAMSSEAQRQLEKLMQHSQQAKLSSGVKRNAQLAELGPDAEMHPNDEDNNMMEDKQNARRMAKFHPQFQPLFIPRAASLRNSFSTAGSSNHMSSQLSGRSGSTPQLGPLSAPLQPLAAPPGSSSFASASNSSLFQGASGLLGQTQSSLSQRRSTGVSSHPSGVAVASLSATAQSVGLSLEQLAVALSSSSNLVKVLSNNSGGEQQQELALRLFRNESRALYQRCMLLAGFRPEDSKEESQQHLQFAFSAWQMEGKRLQELMGNEAAGRGAVTSNNALSASRLGSGRNGNGLNSNSMASMVGISAQQLENDRAIQQQKLQQQQQQQDLQQLQQQQQQEQQQLQQQMQQQELQEQQAQQHDHHSHGHGHAHGHHESNGNGGHDHSHEHGHHEFAADGRHVHQLEGKCGHKAIIHQPKDGSAHIDFVVGDKVECYSGIHPVGNKSVSVWPSKYKCEDLSCPPPCADQSCDDDTQPVQPVDLALNKTGPKILDLSDIDLSGQEWNSDFNGSMGGTLLGLFKLGGDSDKDEDEPTATDGSTNGDGFGISV